MAKDIRRFAVVVPAGTPQSNPVVIDTAMPARIVTAVSILVPPGPRGEVGFALAAAGVQYIPSNEGGWVVADDKVIEWPLEDVIESGAWQMIAYNTGDYDHTLQVIYQCELPGDAPIPPSQTPATLAELGAIVGASVQ